jgi:hypothetical protein
VVAASRFFDGLHEGGVVFVHPVVYVIEEGIIAASNPSVMGGGPPGLAGVKLDAGETPALPTAPPKAGQDP